MGRLLFLLLCFVTLLAPLSTAAGQQQQSGTQQTAELNQERQKASEHFRTINDEVTHLEQSVVIMLGVAALVLTVLFGSTLFGEYRVNQAVKELKQLAEDVKTRFPTLAAMEDQARKALADIEKMFGPAEWVEDRYAKLDIKDRQRILSAEHLIALEFAGRTTAPQLRGMANFYASKYLTEKFPADLDRALYYALEALARGKNKFQYLNDLGLIYSYLAGRDPKYAQLSTDSFQSSKDKQSQQQRCYYNLSLTYFDYARADAAKLMTLGARNWFEKARDELRTALLHANWELTKVEGLTSIIHYNLACCLCLLATGRVPDQGQSADFDEVVHHLERASNHKNTKREIVAEDLDTPTGDLHALKRNSHYRDAVKTIRANFEQSWEEPS